MNTSCYEIELYIDDSGTDYKPGNTIVMAGFAIRSDERVKLENKWRKILHNRNLKMFHTSGFKNIRIFKELRESVLSSNVMLIISTVEYDDWNKVLFQKDNVGEIIGKVYKDPTVYCLSGCLHQIKNLKIYPHNMKIRIIIDERLSQKGNWAECINAFEDSFYNYKFLNAKNCIMLQVADMIANGAMNKYKSKRNSGKSSIASYNNITELLNQKPSLCFNATYDEIVDCNYRIKQNMLFSY